MEQQYYIDIVSSLAERTIKRLWVIVILLIVLLFGSNAAWIYYESQWQVVETSVTQEALADGNGILRDFQLVGGDYYGGESEADSQNQEPQT